MLESLKNFMFPTALWCLISIGWALDPALSLRRLIYTGIVFLSVRYLVELLPSRRVIEIMLLCFCAVLIVDWVTVLLFPFAIDIPVGNDQDVVPGWRGIHLTKNEAGAFCAMCLILTLHETFRSSSYKTGMFICAAAAIFLVETHSKTSLGFIGVSLIIGVISTKIHPKTSAKFVAILVIALVMLACAFEFHEISSYALAMAGDPTSFTGRMQIWSVVLRAWTDHAWFGAGYGSFWGIGESSPILHYGGDWLGSVYEAHNGYLDIMVQIGLIGLIIATYDLIYRPLKKLFTSQLPYGISRSLVCAMLVFALLHNLLETSLLDRSNPMWVIALILYSLLFKEDLSAVASVASRMPRRMIVNRKGDTFEAQG